MMMQQDWESLLHSLTSLGLRIAQADRETGRIVLAVYPLPRSNIQGTE